mmetsp:Transcript_7959/g.11356  ORF Transcript_7959/g.11356 Transcript_7959/m.11356 type:complete len:304 (+) Transcript_7959:91-1002(+)
MRYTLVTTAICILACPVMCFVQRSPTHPFVINPMRNEGNQNRVTRLMMGLDAVTYLRTEWIAAALCTNQTPASAKTVLQLGSEDGRAVNFIPRTVEELITSSVEEDGKLTVSCKRQLKQQRDRRGSGVIIRYLDQAADNLNETEDESVDVVISFQSAERMRELGMDWIQSVREAARVLKPGGRFLFVEQTKVEGIDYVDVVMGIGAVDDIDDEDQSDDVENNAPAKEKVPIFEMVGYDDVDLVLVPHIAGVVVKSENAGLSPEELEAKRIAAEKARIANLSISAFERGLKKRRRKKKDKKVDE